MVQEQREINQLLVDRGIYTTPSFLLDDHRFVGIGHLPLIRAYFLGKALGLAIIHDGGLTRNSYDYSELAPLRVMHMGTKVTTVVADGRLQCVRRRPVSAGGLSGGRIITRDRGDKENNG